VDRIRGILLTVRIQLLKIPFYMAEKYKIESKVLWRGVLYTTLFDKICQ
jgi:hypothetical protein